MASEFISFPNFAGFLEAVIIIAVSLGVGYAIRFFVVRYVAKWAARTAMRFDDVIIHGIKNPILIWSLLVGLAVALEVAALPEPIPEYGRTVVSVLLPLSVAYSVGNILSGLIKFYGVKLGVQAIPMTSFGSYVVRLLVMGLGFMFVLQALDIEITPLLASLGIGALAIAFALQPTLTNIFAGVYLLADKPVKVGDFVRLESGEEGYVTDIGWRSTRIRMLQNNVIVIPNERLSNSIIVNYYLPEKRMALLIQVGAGYDSDPKHVEQVLTDLAIKASYELDGMVTAYEAKPFVRFIPGFQDSSLSFTLICQVREFTDQFYVQHELRKMIYERFREEGIVIPYPIRTLHPSREMKELLSKRS